MTENVMTARSEGLDTGSRSGPMPAGKRQGRERDAPWQTTRKGAERLDAVSGGWCMDFGLFKVAGSDVGNAMRIITSFIFGAVLLAGIIIAYAQTGCSDCRPLPTNPPSPNEGGAPPPGGTGR
jgi:hypothetical protein